MDIDFNVSSASCTTSGSASDVMDVFESATITCEYVVKVYQLSCPFTDNQRQTSVVLQTPSSSRGKGWETIGLAMDADVYGKSLLLELPVKASFIVMSNAGGPWRLSHIATQFAVQSLSLERCQAVPHRSSEMVYDFV